MVEPRICITQQSLNRTRSAVVRSIFLNRSLISGVSLRSAVIRDLPKNFELLCSGLVCVRCDQLKRSAYIGTNVNADVLCECSITRKCFLRLEEVQLRNVFVLADSDAPVG